MRKNALFGLQILILYAAGLQIQPNGEDRDATDNTRLEKSYRYLMFYYYSIVKDNKMALDYANKILEVKPDDEGIQKVVESLSKVVK